MDMHYWYTLPETVRLRALALVLWKRDTIAYIEGLEYEVATTMHPDIDTSDPDPANWQFPTGMYDDEDPYDNWPVEAGEWMRAEREKQAAHDACNGFNAVLTTWVDANWSELQATDFFLSVYELMRDKKS